MEKDFRMYVTNITQAINVLREVGIASTADGTYIRFRIPEKKKTEIILLLNKKQVVVYDIEEI